MSPYKIFQERSLTLKEPSGHKPSDPEAYEFATLVSLFHIVFRPIQNRMERKKDADRQRNKYSPSKSEPSRRYHWREKIEFSQNDVYYVKGVLISRN
ncbi:MAG: hypothetical protein PHI97_09955 [Desulfobulbus sp.]|jgi:hypothetical protein|nr:hypothetical protein [Desulfobulbus sp.]